jgi:RNA polymerase sigma-70 factor (ECF subfamily)
VIYCVVPHDTPGDLDERLRAFFAADPAVEVIVERRSDERRGGDSRRGPDDASVASVTERRQVHAATGRRVDDRRGVLVAKAAPPLPPEFAAESERIRFFERLEPSTLAREDADTARLIARIQAGDDALYSDLYLRYFDRVYAYLRIALHDADEAEDVAQDVFMRVLQAIPNYERREAPFRAWLFRIVRNCAITRLRKSARYTLQTPTSIAQQSDRADGMSSDDVLGSIEDSELVSLIEQLPLGQRQVLLLRYMLDLPNREIAEVLERSPDAVRQLHHRALEVLRGCFEPPKVEDAGRQLGRVRRQPMRRIVRQSPVLRSRRQVA